MEYTSKEIEEKKRIAQLRLYSKRKNTESPSTCVTNSNSSSPHKQYCFKPYSKPKPTLPFYGTTKVVTASCYLISECRFAVDISEYSEEVVNVFRGISSRSYNTKTHKWDFHIRDFENLQTKLVTLQPKVEFSPIPTYALKTCLHSKKNDREIDLSTIDPELLSTLMPFQEDGVRFGIEKNGRCLIADDMGLGKTLQALAIASYYRTDWPLLVTTTTSMKNVWQDAIYKYLPSVSIMEIQYMITSRDYIGDAKVLIVSHDMVARAFEKLKEKKFGIIIIDESHVFKNFRAKCTQAVEVLAKRAKRLVLTSGTPALSRPSELYTQLNLIDDKFFGTFFNYSKRYCDGKNTQYGWDASGQSNLSELEVILNKRFMIRRTKQDVLKMLPKKKQEVVTLDIQLHSLPEDEREQLKNLSALYNNTKKAGDKHAALLTFFAETSKIKIPSVCSYVLQVIDGSDDKFLIFAHHKIMCDAIQQVVTHRNKKFIRIDGSTSSQQRKFFVDKFQLDDSYICAILSITAANTGITLTKARSILFAELHWNPSILSQAESRAHRIGQEEQVVVKYLIAPGTADDPMWNLLLEKQKTLNQIGLFNESFENVTVAKQGQSTGSVQADCSSKELTSFDTLDISAYLECLDKRETNSNEMKTAMEHLDCFNDGMDDVFGSLDI